MKVWLNGKIIGIEEASISPLAHSVQYGSGVFEGIRSYETQNGTAIFRLMEHVGRLLKSAKTCYINLGYKEAEIREAIIKTVKANGLGACYIRPFAYVSEEGIGLSSYRKGTSMLIMALPFGSYFGAGKDKGIRCAVTSINRINSSVLPVQAKVSGNYVNSALANAEARIAGADEAILLSSSGHVSEGPGENIFLVEGNKLVTPGEDSDVLLGITRDSIIKIAEASGIEVEERSVHKEELYTCSELFFTGTAAEITPIVEVDGIKVGNGKPGPITKMLSGKYSGVVTGKDTMFEGWLTYL